MLWLEREAAHCGVRQGDPERYERIAVHFFRRYLGDGASGGSETV
jgi:hypothetical protein